jgi:hypothetical protein
VAAQMRTRLPAGHTPALLQIYRERLRPGSRRPYDRIEQATARIAAALGCPHPYLGTETLSGSKEVWWFNGYGSKAEQKQVSDAYARNAVLLAALGQSSRQKAVLTLPPIEVVARFRPGLSVGEPWVLGRGRFLVVTVASSVRRFLGTVFAAPDGTRFSVTAVQTREQANSARILAGADTVVLAVRPAWTFPAKEWIAMDPAFWR